MDVFNFEYQRQKSADFGQKSNIFFHISCYYFWIKPFRELKSGVGFFLSGQEHPKSLIWVTLRCKIYRQNRSTSPKLIAQNRSTSPKLIAQNRSTSPKLIAQNRSTSPKLINQNRSTSPKLIAQNRSTKLMPKIGQQVQK